VFVCSAIKSADHPSRLLWRVSVHYSDDLHHVLVLAATSQAEANEGRSQGEAEAN
jgi:hypothetical protein